MNQFVEVKVLLKCLKLHLNAVCWLAAVSFFLSSFKHLIGGLDDVSNKGYEDGELKAK